MSGIGPGGVTEDARRWEKEATDLQHTSLKTVRDTAAAWEKSIAALFGVFGLVAFIKGPEAVKDLGEGEGIAVTFLVLVAALLTLVAVYLAALAAQGSPEWVDQLDGAKLREANLASAKGASTRLWVSRFLALFAVALVFIAMAVAWISTLPSGKAEESATTVMLVTDAGLSCGTLVSEGGELRLSPDGKPPGVAVQNVRQVVAVDKCP